MARHSWSKVKEHTYICEKCAVVKVNSQDGGQWITTYHLPDGTEFILTKVPPCEPGPFTESRLVKFAERKNHDKKVGAEGAQPSQQTVAD